MELYQFDCVLHEPREDQGWLYMAEIPELPGCRAWAETPNEALTELSTVAEQFILSYKDRGKPLPAGIAQSVTGQGKISIHSSKPDVLHCNPDAMNRGCRTRQPR